MKKIVCLCMLVVLLAQGAYSQRLGRKEARRLLEAAVAALKASDTAAFTGLWHIDDAPWPYHNRPFTERDAREQFPYLREFLDTALANDLPIDEIEIEQVSPAQQAGQTGRYSVRAWFKYREKYFKGFGFFVDRFHGHWKVRFVPDTSIMTTT